MKEILSKEPDFIKQKKWLTEAVEAAGLKTDYYLNTTVNLILWG